jgi:hypothetical protein
MSIALTPWIYGFGVGPPGPVAEQPWPIALYRRCAAYDLKKLRGKDIVRRIGQTRRYQSTSIGLKAVVSLVVLRNKAIKPLLAAAQDLRPLFFQTSSLS